MTFELSLFHVLTVAFTLVAAFWALARVLLAGAVNSIREQFVEVKAHLGRQDETSRRLERELMDLKAELPRDYVRREDYTQAIATIMTKLDAMAIRFENVVLRARQNNTNTRGDT